MAIIEGVLLGLSVAILWAVPGLPVAKFADRVLTRKDQRNFSVSGKFPPFCVAVSMIVWPILAAVAAMLSVFLCHCQCDE